MTQASDIPKGGWVDAAPAWARPYLRLARLDRPIGTWLLLLPCWWGVALASPDWPSPVLLVLFALGAVAMRGAGCTYNDIVDRDIDGQVARTADRPIPSGAVDLRQALAFLVLQCLVGLAILFTFNWFAVALGIASLVWIAVYPYMKRVTWWPQVFLGLAFNWGALLGPAAVTGGLPFAAIPLYLAGICWTLGYDTIYAHQDKEDDALVGVKSSALWLGELLSRPFFCTIYTLTVGFLAWAGAAADLGWPFYVGLAAAAAHLAWQAWTVDADDPQDCLRKFRSNRDAGLMVFAAIVAGRVFG